MVFINAEEEHKKHYAELEWFFNVLHNTMVNVRNYAPHLEENKSVFVTEELATAIKDLHKWLKLRDKYMNHEIEMTMKTFPEWYMERHKKSYIVKQMKNSQKLWETIHEMEEEDDPSNILQ